MTTLYEKLTDPQTGLQIPCTYSHFRKEDGEVPASPPYVVYIGGGQSTMSADNTYYWRKNQYQIEYYFTKKDEAQEAAIEDILLANGYQYDKSEDVYIEAEDVYVIYYDI